MSETKNPFDEMLKMSQDWAKAMNPGFAAFQSKDFENAIPTMPKELLEGLMGKTFNPSGLDAKTRLLLTLAGLTAQGAQAEPAVRLTARHALEAGATEQEVSETVALMGVFAGPAAMTKALELVGEVLKDQEEGE